MPDDEIQRELEFHPTTFDNLERFSDLYRVCFDRHVGPKYFRWKYCDNPAGSFVGFEAVHKGKTIASYGVIPEPWIIGGQRVTGWQSMDTMTHPDYQRRGLFIKLAKRTYEELAKVDPDHFIFGVPGPMSVRGFLDKLSWYNTGEYPAMFTHRRVLNAMARRSKATVTLQQHHELTLALSDYLRSRPLPKAAATTDFTPEFFSWRVFDARLKSFLVHLVLEGTEPKGLVVSTRDENGWVIVHMLDWHNPADGARLTPAALLGAVDAHASSKLFVLEPRNPEAKANYKRAGLIVNTAGKGPLTYRQPIIGYHTAGTLNGVDLSKPDSYDYHQLMQD
jgi:GNAT superfamily N-acetyltransferase